MVLRRCLRLFAMVLMRLDCLRCDCSGKQSKQLDCLAWSLGLFAFMNHWGKTMNSAGNSLSTIAQRLLPMVLRLLAAEFTGPSPSHFCDAWIGQKYEFIFLNSGKHQSGRSTFFLKVSWMICVHHCIMSLPVRTLFDTHSVCLCHNDVHSHPQVFWKFIWNNTDTRIWGCRWLCACVCVCVCVCVYVYVKKKIQKTINDLLKKFFLAQFSKGPEAVPKLLAKPETCLFINSIEDRVSELKKLKEKTKNHSILTEEIHCRKFRVDLAETGDKGAEPVKTSQQCTPTWWLVVLVITLCLKAPWQTVQATYLSSKASFSYNGNTFPLILVTPEENPANISRTHTHSQYLSVSMKHLSARFLAPRTENRARSALRDFFGTEFFSDGSSIRYFHRDYPKSLSLSFPSSSLLENESKQAKETE